MASFSPDVARQSLSVLEQIERFKDEPLNFEPGSRYRYSNSGYALLGRIIEVVSGLSYETYMERHLLTPLDLNHTYYGRDASIIKGRARGYSRSGDTYINAAYVNDALPLRRWSLALDNQRSVQLAYVADREPGHR